jgi:autotransporter-associated beta strand protein
MKKTYHLRCPRLFGAALAAIALLFSGNVSSQAAPLGNYVSHLTTTSPAAIVITDSNGNLLRLRPYGSNMIRVQASTSASFSPDDRYLMVENHNLGGSLSIMSNSSSALVIANGSIRLTVSKNPLRLSYADADGNPLVSDANGIDLNAATMTYNFTPDDSEKIIGYGQKRLALQDTFQLAGRTERRNYGEEGYPGRGAQGVLCIPFYMSSKGYGFFANTTFPHEGRFNTNGEYNFRIEIKNLATPEADYFFIYGPKPADILDHYTLLTGRPRMPRKAIFGLQLSDNEPSQPTINQDWWQNNVTAHLNAGFPLDHMVFDNDWRAASPLEGGVVGQWGGSQFAFDPGRYPNPPSFRDWYDEKGLTLTLDLNLNNCNDSEGWQPSYNIPPYKVSNPPKASDTSDPDYSNPATRSWLWKLFWDKALNPALGYPGDAIWLDESDGIWRHDNQLLANGRPWWEMKNYYFFLTAYAAVAEGWDNVEGGTTPGIGEAKRPWIWIRGGSPGMQRYASHWTGDIEFSTNFWKGNIISMQASGLAGFPYYNHDAGSFGSSNSTNNPDPDPDAYITGPNDHYYIQWGCALGSFSPIWRPHGYGRPRWPMNRNAECQEAFRRYATLRYEMMPYIYSLAHDSHSSGLPMARPMALAFPDSPEAWDREQEYQYMWGDSMLVVPNFHLKGNDEIRTAWLPPAVDWYDFWTDQPVNIGPGGGFHTFNARFGFLPIFVKAGAIIPYQDFALTTAFLSDTNLTLDVYSGDSGTFTLTEDDGITERFRTRSERRITQFTYAEPGGIPTFNIGAAGGTYLNASANRSYLVRLRGVKGRPQQVTVDGTPVSVQTAPLPAGTTTAAAWDSENRLLLLRIAPRAVTSPVAIVVTPAATPAAPTALSATAVSGSQINLTWTDNASNETGFKIYRRIGLEGTYEQVAGAAANSTSFNDTGLSGETLYFYRVAATNASGESVWCPETSATTFTAPPTAPTGLSAATAGPNAISLSWTDTSNNETGFLIERSLSSSGGFSVIASVAANVTNFTDTALTANTVFFYRVAAANGIGSSPYSNIAEGTTVLPPLPSAPTGLSATVFSGSQIDLSWTDTSTNESGFKLMRKTGAGGTYTTIATVAPNTTIFFDSGLNSGTTYFYRLVATNIAGDSGFSNEASATTPVLGQVTLSAGDGYGATSFNTSGNWNSGQAPNANNDYFTASHNLRTPSGASGNLTFAGNSLSIDGGGELVLKGADGSALTFPLLKLNGGSIRSGNPSMRMTLHGNIRVLANSTLDGDGNSREMVLNNPITGSANLNVVSLANPSGIVRLTGNNDAFEGDWSNAAASILQVGDGGTGGSLGSGDVANSGSLVFNRAGNMIVNNRISGSGSVTLNGFGTLTFTGANSYTGATAINGGTLLVNGSLANTAVTAGFSTSLGGSGTIAGPVSILGGFAPGANGIGTLTINNSLTLSGGATFELNRSLSPPNDRAVVSGALNAGGSLAVYNLGEPLSAGDTFALFNKGVSGNFSSVTLPPLTAGLAWENNLTVDGTLSVYALPLGAAANPIPADGATGIATNTTLAWQAGDNAVAHRLYFGANESDVTAATTNSPEFKGTLTATQYAPGALAHSGRFYWRVDAVGPAASLTGETWTFATLAGPTNNFLIEADFNETFALSFPSHIGQTYRAEQTDKLTPTNWQIISNNIPGTGAAINISDTDSTSATQRFYRVMLLSPNP